MVFFKDFGKTINDLFKGDKYTLNRTLNIKAKSADSEWETKTVLSNGSLSTKLVYKQSDPSLGAVELTVPTKGNLEVDYTTPKLAKGLKTNVVVKQPNVDLKGKYTNGAVEAKCEAKINADSTSLESVYCDAAMGFDGFSVGGAVKIKPGNENMLADYNVGFQYARDPSTTFSVTTANSCNKLTTSALRSFDNGCNVGFRYTFDLDKPAQPAFEIGGKCKVDDNGTLQGVLRTGNEACLLYKHVLSNRLTASLGAVFNTQDMSAASTSINYKLEFVV